MSGVLIFDSAELLPVIEHAIAAKAWKAPYGLGDAPTVPSIDLVGDEGVYVLSGSTERQMNADGTKTLVVYAKGIDPAADPEGAWENKRLIFGGDDGVESLPWAEEIKRCIDRGDPTIRIAMYENQIQLVNAVRDVK